MWTVGRWTRVAVLLLTAVASAYGEWHGKLIRGYFTLPGETPVLVTSTLHVTVP